ncbi:MAG: hypothetical protein K2N64_05685 [Anaeroplasmataceae bacterium]|nr:hypothetical protein [Anaeroplasmataceae bacterium]
MNFIEVKDKVYSVVKLLGHGKGGYSYLVTDGNSSYVCKQIHHEPCSYYTFGNKLEAELRDYNTLRKLRLRLPKLYEVDIKKERILKEYISGPTIYDLVAEDKMEEKYLDAVRKMCLDLYPAHLNIDYFPTNFVVQNEKLYYVDYECNEYMEEWNFENWGIKYWSKTKEFIEYQTTHKKEREE